MNELFAEYGLNKNDCNIKEFGSGLINNTWLLTSGESKYILQKINKNVFIQPKLIDENINTIAEYLRVKNSGYTLNSAPIFFR